MPRRAFAFRIATLLLALAFSPGPATAQNSPGSPDRSKGGSPLKTETQVPPEIVQGNSRLATDLYKTLAAEQGNRFFSPYSLSTALGMTFAGARGETADQMARILHFDLPADRLHPAFRALIGQINGEAGAEPRPYQLLTANALWGQKGETFLDGFLKLTRENYGAGLKEVDFRRAAEPARLAINAWVEEQTRDKIKDLLASSDVGPDTSLILTNAIYFKGDWLHPFQEEATRREGVFQAGAGRRITTPMMTQLETFRHHDGGTFQLLELPYVGGDLSMVVLLPKALDGLPALESQLSASQLSAWVGQAKSARVALQLPKFTMTEELRLSEVLRRMGLTLPFEGGKADFSGINGKRDLMISEVIHKAFVDVHEKGTEAAAATAVAMMRASAAIPAPPIEFKADHPFVFLIRDQRTGSLLFLGRLTEPKG